MIIGEQRKPYIDIFKAVNSYDVYKHYLGFDFIPRRLYPSPFRRDRNGSFGITLLRSGNFWHKDFGDSRYKGNCIQFVQQLFNLSYSESIQKIIEDLNLDSNSKKRILSQFNKEKAPTLIQIIPKTYTCSDLRYWNLYGIDRGDLSKEDIYSIGKLFINKSQVSLEELSFAYYFRSGEEEYIKVYQPYSKKFKWLSNVPVKKALNLDKLELKSNTIVVGKSKKDKLVLNKLITDVYECQKEGTEVITDEVDSFFDANYDRKVCFFDNDEAGRNANIALNPRGYGWINIPNHYYKEGIKDPSDLVKKYGYNVLEELLRKKELL